MPSVKRIIPLKRKPNYLQKIDWSNPITKGLVFQFGTISGLTLINPASNINAVLSNNTAASTPLYTNKGLSIRRTLANAGSYSEATIGMEQTMPHAAGNNWEYTFLLVFKPTDISVAFHQIFEGNGDNPGLFINASGGVHYYNGLFTSANGTIVVDKWHTLIVKQSASGSTLFVNGKKIITGNANTTTQTVNMSVGGGAGDSAMVGDIADVKMWDRKLSDKECVDISANLEMVYQPQAQNIFFPIVAAQGIVRRRTPHKKKPSYRVQIVRKYKKVIKYAYIFNAQRTLQLLDRNISNESGVTYSHDGVTFDGLAGTQITLNAPIDLTNSNECTVIFRFAKGITTVSDGIFSDKVVVNWGSTDGFNISLKSTGGILLKIGVSETYTESNYFNDQLKHTCVCMYKAGELSEIFIDGIEVSYITQGLAPSFVKSSSNARIGSYHDDSAGRVGTGSLDFLYVFDRKLDLNEAFSISNNPYQLLQSREQLIPFGVAAITAIIGTVSETTDSSTVSSSGQVGVDVGGSIAETTDDSTVSSSGQVGLDISGSIVETTDNSTGNVVGLVGSGVLGTIAETTDSSTVSSSGQVGIDVSGSVSSTTDSSNVVSIGQVGLTITGSVSSTTDSSTVSSTGNIESLIVGTVVITTDNSTANIVGRIGSDVSGAISVSLDDSTANVIGQVGAILTDENDISLTAPFGFADINLTGAL